MKRAGYVEFKYRKDSVSGVNGINGEFKFLVGDSIIFVDNDYTRNGWQVFNYTIPNKGIYDLAWIYTKQNDYGEAELMSCEFETIKVIGSDFYYVTLFIITI